MLNSVIFRVVTQSLFGRGNLSLFLYRTGRVHCYYTFSDRAIRYLYDIGNVKANLTSEKPFRYLSEEWFGYLNLEIQVAGP